MRERSSRRWRWCRVGFGVVILVALAATRPAAAQENPFSINGAPQKHGSDSALGGDYVDPLSGNLLLTHTDLAVPGNAGFDLRVTRYYNSNIYRHFADGTYTYEEPSWVGVGWRLHFGRVIHPDSQVAGELQIEMPDGSRHAVYQVAVGDPWWRSADFFLYNPTTHVLKLPNGLVYTFNHVSIATDGGELGAMRYVTEIRDPFDNTLAFSYFAVPGPTGGVQQIQQDLGNGQVRTVTFDWDRSNHLLASMTYNGRTWTYQYLDSQVPGYSLLEYVNVPRAGSGLRRWTYYYGNTIPAEEIGLMKAPTGGEFHYTYGTVTRIADDQTYPARVVTQRTVIQDGDIAPAGWSFSYNQGAEQNETHVQGSAGLTVYAYNGIGTQGPFNVWQTGTLRSVLRLLTMGPSPLERQDFTYTRSEPLVNVPIGDPGDPWYDDAVYRPLLAARTVSRDVGTANAASWLTTYRYRSGGGTFNDYGQPWKVCAGNCDTGPARTTERTYSHSSNPYIVGRVLSETTSYAAGGSTTQSATFDGAFTTSVTTDGVTTTLSPAPRGNVASATNARGYPTTYQYAWGAVSRVETPRSLTVRTIPGPDPVPTQETIGKAPDAPLTTAYTYDALGRVSVVTPPGSTGSEPSPAPIVYTYDDTGDFQTWTRVTRGYGTATIVTSYHDAFGRVRRTESSGGATTPVKVAVHRDGEGREVCQTAPYTGADPTTETWPTYRGTRTTYDALGRVTKVEVGPANPNDPDYSATTYSYAGAKTTVTDPKGYPTVYEYGFFSGPGDGRLVKVTDAKNQVTTYGYRLTNTLTSAQGPGCAAGDQTCTIGLGPVRTWTYDPTTNRLFQEQHPESGLVEYGYDAVGNAIEVKKRQADGTFETTTIVYDELNQPTSRATAGSGFAVTWTYDTFGRTTAVVTGEVTTNFGFDAATGRPTTRTDIRTGHWGATSAYQFDGRDRLTRITYRPYSAIPRRVDYTYDDQGRVLSVANNSVPFATGFLYDASGRLASYVTGAVTHTVGYDQQDRVDAMTTAGLQGPNLNVAYTHDRAGNVASLVDGGAVQTFGHDALHRLTDAAGPWGLLGWAYDPTGNRLSENAGGATTTFTYDSANRLAATGGTAPETFTYDAFGRLTQDSQGTYTYRPDGAPATATRTGMSATYVSNGDGERMERSLNGQRVVTFRSLGGQVLSEYEIDECAGVVWRRDLIYAGGRLLGSVKNATPRPSIAFAAASSSVAENAGSASIAVQLTAPAPLGCPVSVSYQTHNGTARAGQDYTTGFGTLTFPAGSATGATQIIPVGLLDDLVYEGAETVAVTLATPIGADLGAISSHTLTIAENEAVPSLSVADVTVQEGPWTAATFTVTMSATCAWPVSVAYATANGTATAGQDYTATSGTLTIPAGGTSATVSVPILNDALLEPNEAFTLTLSSPTSPVTLSRATATGTIVDTQRPIDRVRRDAVTWQATTGTWQVRRGTDNYQTLSTYQWGSGAAGDIPVPGDWDGDGVIDLAVWRRPTGVWYVLRSSANYSPGSAQTFQLGGGTPTVTSGLTVIAQPPSSPPVEGMWQPLGVTVAAGDLLTITAPGTWTSGTAFTANGDPNTVLDGTNCPLPGAHLMALVGRIGPSGTPFLVGAQGTVTAPAAGQLYLAPNDNWYTLWDNSGSLAVTVSKVEGAALTEVPVPADYDGDGKLDPGVWRPSTGRWTWLRSEAGYAALSLVFGGSDDVPLPGEYGSDGKADPAVWRAFDATWSALTSDSGYTQTITSTWGAPAATCTPNLAVSGAPPSSPPLTAMWQATGVTVTAGQTVSVTASGTWTSGTAFTADGDPNTLVSGDNCPLSGARLMALVARVGPTGTPFVIGQSKTFTAPASGELFLAPNDNWYTLWDNSGALSVAVCVSATGAACDQAVPADYDGDRRVDPAVWTPTTGTWSILRSTTGYLPGSAWSWVWGGATYGDVLPMAADFDGDGQADATVWRGPTGEWWVRKTGGGDPYWMVWTMGTQAEGFQPVRVR